MSDRRLDLVVIHPGDSARIYGPLASRLAALEPPLWARLIAGYCRDRGWGVAIIDAEAQRLDPTDVARFVQSMNPRLVCVAVYGHQPSASTQQMPAAIATVAKIKELGLDTGVIMAGGHVSALPLATMLESATDFVCMGEGPITVDDLLRNRTPSEIPGLVWRDEGMVRANGPAPVIQRLAGLGGDAWDLLPMGIYRAHNWHAFGAPGGRMPYASIYTSLGCPFKCGFCCINAPFGGPGYRMRPAEAVVDEIDMLRTEYGVRNIKISDELFVLNKVHVMDICKGIVRRGLTDLNIWAYARPDTVNPTLLPVLRDAGVRWLALGIESGDLSVRRSSGKGVTTDDDIVNTINAIRAYGINVIGNYIFGLEHDTFETMQATLDLALELNTEFANFYSAMAYPGSALHQGVGKSGRKLPNSWAGYSQHAWECEPLGSAALSPAQVLKFRDQAFHDYFDRESYQRMILSKFGDAAMKEVQDMTMKRLPRMLVKEALI